ncbi:LAME_0G07228g1_1 [Lachancea meyersii CBS 8951]|uniref:LAME_0G07228g1_1 n=1 Tax=Lachancea meyersii CBS 8951 TaxID=1266667 RepID=A0A1G4K7U9_9SACH|nr:LAME_0G07228g1_1 [Lachancea meyersii CBS 8951]
MAKRHGHYRARGTGRRQAGRGNYKKAKNTRKQTQNSKTGGAKNANFVPVGGGDLSNMDMMDDYYFGQHYGQQSMHVGGFRPGRDRISEEETQEKPLPLRRRPVEFTKAKQVYDPSHDLILKLSNKGKEQQTKRDSDLSDGETVQRQEVQETVSDEPFEIPIEVLESSEEMEIVDNESEEIPVEFKSVPPRDFPDEELFYVDETPSTRKNVKTVHVDAAPKKLLNNEAKTTEFEPVLVIGKTQLNLAEEEDGSASVCIPHNWKTHPFKSKSKEKLDFETFSDESECYDNDYDDYDEVDDHEIETNDDSDDFARSQDSQEDVNPKGSTILSSTIQSLTLSEEPEPEPLPEPETKESVPEFGFLEEDFALNVSELEITNIRIGSREHSYYLSSYRYFGDYDPRWVDQDDLAEFVTELGLPDHRVEAYLQYVMDSLVPKEEAVDALEASIAREAAVLASETESAEEDVSDKAYAISDDDDDSLGEDLDDLVAYSMKYEAVRNKVYDTKSLQTSGKGAKKKLLLSEQLDLDSDVKSKLQDKFTTRNDNKRIKRQTKEDYISLQNSTSEDLTLKYPYGFHVENIKDEFDAFLACNRPTMSFPPFDPHGNKTVMSFADAYYMKGKKMGKAGKTFVMVEKVKRTKWALPNYNYVGQLLNRRRIFMRIDVRRPREEHQIFDKMGSGKAKFQVKEGEIVGEDAPEIGTDNIGRRMLEKLGWSSGQGLGAHGNQGISEPIFAKVKKSKSGLRHS